MNSPVQVCPVCSRARGEGDRFCANCGHHFEEPPAPAPTEPAARRWPGAVLPSNLDASSGPAAGVQPTWRAAQSPWLIGVLVFATGNLYGLWWFGRTWWQIKQEDGDAGKRPVWHALAMLVPIYGYFRFHAHIRSIVGLAATPAARTALNPGAMTVAWIVINLLDGAASQSNVWIAVLGSALGGALFGWAQNGLNTTWASLPGGYRRRGRTRCTGC